MAKKHYLKLSEILKKLLASRKMRPAHLAQELDLPTPTVHRMVTGKSTRPYKSSLEPIADFFDISVDQLIGDEPLPDETSATSAFPKPKSHIIELPLIQWEELADIEAAREHAAPIAAMNDLSTQCFGVRMNDSSMYPQFSHGDILILDPNKKPFDRSFILVNLGGQALFVLRQLLIDAENRFLKPLNPDLLATQMRLLDQECDIILGTLVEARQVYQGS